jgi:hypothetical protein
MFLLLEAGWACAGVQAVRLQTRQGAQASKAPASLSTVGAGICSGGWGVGGRVPGTQITEREVVLHLQAVET